jgi:hypothetical protein
MKKAIFTIAIALFTVFSLSAQVTSEKSQQERKPTPEEKIKMDQERQQSGNPDPNAPEIDFDKLVHDYGEIEQHGDGKCEFKFTNNGKEPLILSNVRSSCGCTVPQWPRQPILPGESETIKVKYDTKRIGIINKSIHVYSNAKTSPVTLKIKGKVLAEGESKMPEKNMETSGSPVNK